MPPITARLARLEGDKPAFCPHLPHVVEFEGEPVTDLRTCHRCGKPRRRILVRYVDTPPLAAVGGEGSAPA